MSYPAENLHSQRIHQKAQQISAPSMFFIKYNLQCFQQLPIRVRYSQKWTVGIVKSITCTRGMCSLRLPLPPSQRWRFEELWVSPGRFFLACTGNGCSSPRQLPLCPGWRLRAGRSPTDGADSETQLPSHTAADKGAEGLGQFCIVGTERQAIQRPPPPDWSLGSDG